MSFADVLKRYRRVAITGAPRTGKTSLVAQVTDRPVFHTDDWMRSPWSEVPLLVKGQCETAGDRFVVEGVQVPRTLRKGLEVDAVIYLTAPKVAQNRLQVAMGKAVDTVLNEWRAANPLVPVFTEDQLMSLTIDRADVPQTTRRYLCFTVDDAGFEPTPQGGRRYRAKATKAGVFQYNRGGQVVREYRPADEIKRALSTLKSAPVVILHPKENGGEVSPDNMRRLRVGVFEDPAWDEAEEAAVGSVVVDDAEALATIDSWLKTHGGVDISCGYDNDRIPEPGVSPDGEEYDLVQTDYVFNHVAIGPRGWGRQGSDVGLTLDSEDNEEDPMKFKTNDSKDMAPAAADGETKTADESLVPVAAPLAPIAAPAADAATLTPEDIAGVRELLKMLPLLTQLANTGGSMGGETIDQAKPTDGQPPAQAPASQETTPMPQQEPKKTLDANDIERIAQEGAEVRADAQRLIGTSYSFRGRSTRQVRTDVIKTFDSAFDDKDLSDAELLAAYKMAARALEQRSELTRQLGATRSLGFEFTADASDENKPKVTPIGHDIYSA